MLTEYTFDDITEIIGKITTCAILHHQLDIIKHFYPPSVFESAPDITFTYLINSIKYGSNLDIVKYFIENGVDIRQENYRAVQLAAENNRKDIIEYFYKLRPEIEDKLNDEQREKYGFVKTIIMDKYIGTEISCNIFYDDILANDKYYQCSNKIHNFKDDAWMQLMKRRKKWECPVCKCDVKRILYINNPKAATDN